MKYFLHLFVSLLFVLPSGKVVAAASHDGITIQSIRFQQQEQREIVQIRLSGRVEPETFELEGDKPRFVLDFPATEYSPEQQRVIAAGGSFIERIRVGVHTTPITKTRVVIDLVKHVPLVFSREYRLSDKTYVVTISSEQIVSERRKKKSEPEKNMPETSSAKDDEAGQAGSKATEVAPLKPASASAPKTLQPDTKGMEAEATPEKAEKTGEPGDAGQEQEADGKTTIRAPQESGFERDERQQSPPERLEAKKKRVKEIPKLLDVSYENSTNGQEMVLFRLNGFFPPMVYSAEGNELLVVCEFEDGVVGDGVEPVLEAGGEFIDSVEVRSIETPKKIRVLLTLRGTYTYDLKQVFFKEDNLFVVIISKLGEDGPAN